MKFLIKRNFRILSKQRHFCWSVWAKCFKKDIILKSFEKIKIDERLSYGEDVLFCYIYFMFCEKIAVFKTCIYHYEFNPNGRYENKNKEILNQNYKDKKKSNEIIKRLSKEFLLDEFHQKLFEVLKREEAGVKNRLDL